MRLPFRKKDKKRDGPPSPLPPQLRSTGAWDNSPLSQSSQRSARLLATLPAAILEEIFAFVCPHASDESYETCEGSASEGCMLCDSRDLSHCTRVNRAWRAAAIKCLYHSVRIDPVHYCQMEAFLAERRKKTSRFNKNGIPEDPALARLRLLRRTVRDDPTRIGKLVQFLKTPYMIRECRHVELAQTIAVLPNLKYVDLPEGMFSDDPAYATLRLEVQARCPDMRKTTYSSGAEQSFATLASGQIWPRLEVLELNSLQIDPMLLRTVLTCLPNLRALKTTETYSLSDEVLVPDEYFAPLPALEELVLKDTPNLTSVGLVDYLSAFETQHSLKVLMLKDTGIQPWRLQEILAMAPSLVTLAIQSKVSEQFPVNEPVQPLAHSRLRTLRYEVSAEPSLGPFAVQGYYSYLSNSVLLGGLPGLRTLYVLDAQFPEQLQSLPPPMATFAGGQVRSPPYPSAARPPSVRVSPPHASKPLSSPTRQGFGNMASSHPQDFGGMQSPTRSQFANMPSPTRQQFGSLGSPTHQNFAVPANPNRFSSNNPFAQAPTAPAATHELEVFSKADELGQWNFARVESFTGAGAPPRRPISSYGLAADVAGQGWDRGMARRSVLKVNGPGAFLTASGAPAGPGEYKPDGHPSRPRSSVGDVRKSHAMWK